jgi:VanZ family protein
VSSNVSAGTQHPIQTGAEVPVERIRLLSPSLRILAKNWWPSLVWLGIIRTESTDAASFDNTLGWLHTVLFFLVPHISGGVVWQLNEVLRKTGHFLGYGILSVLVFYGLRYTNRDQLSPLLLRRWGTCLHDLWRMEWVLLGVAVTVITAALDEIHQSFIPSRTGCWQDVVLDTCGAAALQVFVYLFALWSLNRRREHEPIAQPQFSSTR